MLLTETLRSCETILLVFDEAECFADTKAKNPMTGGNAPKDADMHGKLAQAMRAPAGIRELPLRTTDLEIRDSLKKLHPIDLKGEERPRSRDFVESTTAKGIAVGILVSAGMAYLISRRSTQPTRPDEPITFSK